MLVDAADLMMIIACSILWSTHAEPSNALGMRKVPVVCVSHLSEAAIRAYMLADNRLPEKAGWSRELLALELQELAVRLPEIDLEIGITGFEPAEIDALLIDFGEGAPEAADDIPALDANAVVARQGDLFRLG